MPTIPYVRATHSAGGSWTAAKANVLEAGCNDLSYAPCVRVTHNANQSITTATATALAFNTEIFDQAGNAADTMHDTVTNNSRLTCRYAGVYQITGHIEWAASAVGQRTCQIRHQGATIISPTVYDTAGTGVTQQCVTTLWKLAVNEYVELLVTQNSGGGLNVTSNGSMSPVFMMVRVG